MRLLWTSHTNELPHLISRLRAAYSQNSMCSKKHNIRNPGLWRIPLFVPSYSIFPMQDDISLLICSQQITVLYRHP